MKRLPFLLATVTAFCFGVIAAFSFECLREIHSFEQALPKSLSMEQAAYASIMELMKVALISFPLLALMALCCFAIFMHGHGKHR